MFSAKKFKFLMFMLLPLLIIAVAAGCREEQRKKLIMVTNATFPPYEYVHGSEIDGIDPAIIRLIADKLGYDVEIQDMAFDSVIAAVQSGKADIAASGITVTEERKKQVSFTIPYVIAKQVIIVRKDSDIKSSADLKKCRIGVQHGTTGDLYVSQNIREPERFSSGPLAIAALHASKIDAAVVDDEPAQNYIKQRPGLKILPEELTREEYAFAINKDDQSLLHAFNTQLAMLQQSGELAAIIREYREESRKENVVANYSELSFWERCKDSIKVNFVSERRYMYLLRGFAATIEITVAALLIGIAIGFIVAVIRSTADQTGSYKIPDLFCRFYLTIIRGTPVVVQLLIIYFVIFGMVDIDKTLVAIIAFGINSGAYVAEIIRGGIDSIDKGQMEAGRSLGLSHNQTMCYIILPQAFKNVLPALGNEMIVLLKETSVAGYIALHDLTKGGDIIRSQTYDAFLPLIAVALIYLAVVMLFSWLLRKLELRLKKNE